MLGLRLVLMYEFSNFLILQRPIILGLHIQPLAYRPDYTLTLCQVLCSLDFASGICSLDFASGIDRSGLCAQVFTLTLRQESIGRWDIVTGTEVVCRTALLHSRKVSLIILVCG
jgi:hypothetical protein